MSTNLSILLVEDNESLREEMVCFLNRPGWSAAGVDCGEELNYWLMQNHADIVILDVNLPYEDGYSIASRLRVSHPDLGIVMLTARVRPIDRTEGYSAGADVYLSKPTQPNELIAVIDNLGKRLRRPEVKIFSLNALNRTLQAPGGEVCNLTPNECKLLELLALSPGREADAEYLMYAVGARDEKELSKEGLATTISRLRGKCKQTLGLDNLVVVNRGVGYRLTVALQLK